MKSFANLDGAYSTICPHTDCYRHDADVPVEGMREGWLESLAALPSDPAERRGYLLALFKLNGAALPPAFHRSLPIWRFQEQLARMLAEVSE